MSDTSEPRGPLESKPPVHSLPHAPAELPRRGPLLGLDFGTRRIGISISDDEQKIACPLENYDRRRRELDESHLAAVARDYRATGLVVGLPLHMGGEEGLKAQEARRFGAWVASAVSLPLAFWDERLTSALAEELLIGANVARKKRKSKLDMVAAQIMLQSFLDSRRAQAPAKE